MLIVYLNKMEYANIKFNVRLSRNEQRIFWWEFGRIEGFGAFFVGALFGGILRASGDYTGFQFV
jgi:hypothetical protein